MKHIRLAKSFIFASLFVAAVLPPIGLNLQASAATGEGGCRDLKIASESSSAMAGNVSLIFLVANSGTNCTLRGIPTVTMRSVNDALIAENTVSSSQNSRTTKFTLEHNSVASFKVSWTDEPVRNEVRRVTSNVLVNMPYGTQSVDFALNEAIYGRSLGVSALTLGANG